MTEAEARVAAGMEEVEKGAVVTAVVERVAVAAERAAGAVRAGGGGVVRVGGQAGRHGRRAYASLLLPRDLRALGGDR